MSSSKVSLSVSIASLLIPTLASAATFFSDNLTTGTNFTAHSNIAAVSDGSGYAASTPTFGVGGVTFDPGVIGDGGRTMVSTNDTNYYSTSFTASVIFTQGATQGAFYMGMGKGDQGPNYTGYGAHGGSFYYSPDSGVSSGTGAWIAWDPRDTAGSGRYEAKSNVDGDSADLFVSTENPFTSTAPYGPNTVSEAMMSWNAGTHTMTWSLDIGDDGTIDESHSAVLPQAVVDQWSGATGSDPSAIYFGGSEGMVATNFSVVPEPSSAMLAGLAGLGMLMHKRRRGSPRKAKAH